MKNTQTTQDFKSNLIDQLTTELHELESDMRCSCLTDTPFVLACGGLYISPILADDGKGGKITTGKVNWHVNPLRATRFSRENAEYLAPTIRNGAGDTGEAVGIYQAVRTRHAVVTNLLKTLNA